MVLGAQVRQQRPLGVGRLRAGAEVVLPLKDEDYGSRGFTVRDPEGNRWSFGTYAGGATD